LSNPIQNIIYSGISGLVLPVPNKIAYPEEFRDKSRLTYYASLFNSLEVNSSFYKVPMASTIARWADSVPEPFRFTFKLWKGITHNKGLHFNVEDIYYFIKVIGHAANKKGCLLVQFPASITIAYLTQFEKLIETISAANESQQWKV
jgi:uncharacterized protein YecE (DUF72 family)